MKFAVVGERSHFIECERERFAFAKSVTVPLARRESGRSRGGRVERLVFVYPLDRRSHGNGNVLKTEVNNVGCHWL